MANLNVPRKAIIIFIIAVLALMILVSIVFSQRKTINTQGEKIKSQQKFILAGVKKSLHSQPSSSQIESKEQELQSVIDKLKKDQISAESELSGLKQEAEAAQKAQNSSKEKTVILQKDNQQLKTEISNLKSALSEKKDSEIKAEAAPVENGQTKQKEIFSASGLQIIKKRLDKLNEENANVTKEKEGLNTLIKQLKADNKNLQDINEKLKNLNGKTEEKAKEIFLQLKGKEQLQEQVKQANSAIGVLSKERAALLKNIERLKARVVDLEEENAALYGKSGDAFMRAGFTDEAIDAFNNAVRLNPRNAEAHYKLGFLYKRSLSNNAMAVYHFKKYLALEPKSKSRRDIEYLIQMLSQYDWDVIPKN